MNSALAQLGVAGTLIALLLWLLLRANARIEVLEQRLVEKDSQLLDTTDRLRVSMLEQHTELSDRLLRQAVETAPLLREALDLLRQAAAMFEVMRQSANGRQ
jgi:hypothetical protein